MVHRKKSASPTWPRPSARVRALIRTGAELALHAAPEWYAEIDAATLGADRTVADDPVLTAATRRSNRDTLLHWATANMTAPGAPVVPNLGPDMLGVARDLVRRGLGTTAIEAFRAGQNAAWLRWMQIAFALTQDPAELQELLAVTARSITSFVDATVAGLAKQMEAERIELTRGTHAERREVVTLVLDGAPLRADIASKRLGYGLDATHRAAIVWNEQGRSEPSVLEAAAEALVRELGATRPLTVVVSAATLWVWVASDAEPNVDRLRTKLRNLADVRLAVGSKGAGVEGFRSSHLDALTAQRLAARAADEPRVVSFDEVRLAALVAQDVDAAEDFIAHTLGDLASAPAELREALSAFLDEGCNSSNAALRLRAHRNTLLRRLKRAEKLLPRPLEANRLHVGVALEIAHWQRAD